MRLGVVIPCYRQAHHLPRTLAALEHALAGHDWQGVVVMSAAGDAAPAIASERWRVIAPPVARDLTPGGARMLGLAAVPGDWVLFLDADVEVDAGWIAACLERMQRADASLAGLWGRIEEWFEDAAGVRPGSPDLLRAGRAERDVAYATAVVFYRRELLVRAGGYEPRLRSEEDFELGLRITRAGGVLRLLPLCAGRHWSGPRPSFRELGRRWTSGLCFGQGQVLRLYAGRPGFGAVLRRQSLYLVTLALWAAGVAALLWFARTADARPVLLWSVLAAAGFAAMALRKHSLRLALFSVLTWSVNGAGLVAGLLRGLEPVPPAVDRGRA